MSKSESESIGLTELIDKVKQDLLASSSNTDTGAPVFFVDTVELELKVAAKREAGGGLKIDVLPWSPVKAGAEAKASVAYENAHTVKVKLSPLYDKEKILAWHQLRNPNQEPQSLDKSVDMVLKSPTGEENLADR